MIEDFIFDGMKLSDLNYIIVSDGIADEVLNVSNANFATIKAPRSDVSHNVGVSYEENYTRTIRIMKDPCKNQDNLDLTNEDISELTKWLCRKEYKWFRWIDDIGQDEIWYETMNTINKIEYGTSVIGLEITIFSNRPYALTREYHHEWIGGTEHPLVYVYSDEEGYIYPDMEITVKGGGTVQIYSNLEQRMTEIKNCVHGEVITIDGGDTLQITTSIPSHDLSKDFNYKYVRLCNKYRDCLNEFYLSDNCNISMTYRGIRKVGL